MIVRLRIEENYRASKKKAGKTFTIAKANVVEHEQNPKKRKANVVDRIPKRGRTSPMVQDKVPMTIGSSKENVMCATN